MPLLSRPANACAACQGESSASAVCAACLARHHPGCWQGCASCGGGERLQACREGPPRRALRVVHGEVRPPDATPWVVLLCFCVLYVGLPLGLCLLLALVNWLRGL